MLKNIYFIKEYLPLIAAVTTACLTYAFGYRKGKTDIFHAQLKESLDTIISPMYHDIRNILKINTAFRRRKALEEFFCKYNYGDTCVYKVGDRIILECYYEADELFYIFQNDRNEENWENFCTEFNALFVRIQNEYQRNRDIIYSEYVWLKEISEKNYLVRLIFQICAFVYETVRACIIFSDIMIFGLVIEGIKSSDKYNRNLILIWATIFVISIMLYFLLSMILVEYKTIKKIQRRKSHFRRFLEKRLPSIFKSTKNSKVDKNIKKKLEVSDII